MRAPPPREVVVSKKISWVLRHGAEKEGLELDGNGYARVDELVSLALVFFLSFLLSFVFSVGVGVVVFGSWVVGIYAVLWMDGWMDGCTDYG